MGKKEIYIQLTERQIAKIRKKFPNMASQPCNAIVVDSDDLVETFASSMRYQAPQICIDFNDEQETVVQEAFPDKGCDFAIIDETELGTLMRYMAPPEA